MAFHSREKNAASRAFCVKNIAMGYVKNGHHKKGTELAVEVRNKIRKAIVTPMPFVPSKFYRGPEKS